MEKNDFLLYNEVLYRLHDCQTGQEFAHALLTQLRLLLPFSYASFVPITVQPDTGELLHGAPLCQPPSFAQAERAWLATLDRADTAWLSHAPEATVVRDSELFSGERRFATPSYATIYRDYGIHDCIQVNLVYGGQPLGRLALYRTREDGLFTDRDAFFLRALSNHLGLACHRCLAGQAPAARQDLSSLSRRHGLTKREEEVLELIFQDKNNEEILQDLCISRNTLLKHLQNLYRKCGVSSRWDLRKLRGE